MSQKPFTGITRNRQTRPWVKLADRVMRGLITAGGIGTIVSVLLIMAFLVWVVFPLFTGGELVDADSRTLDPPVGEARAIRVGVDEYRTTAWALSGDGTLTSWRLEDGRQLRTISLFPDGAPTSIAFTEGSNEAVFGFADGTVRRGEIHFETGFLDLASVPPDTADRLRAGESATIEGGVAALTPEGQVRVQTVAATIGSPNRIGADSPIVALDYSLRPIGPAFAALTANNEIIIREGRENMLTGELTFGRRGGAKFDAPIPSGRSRPDHLMFSGLGTTLYLVWEDGLLLRMNVSDPNDIREGERIDLLPDPSARITVLRFLAGKTTLLVGDSAGNVRNWFPAKPEGAETIDGEVLVNPAVFRGPGAAVSAIAPSWRSRIAAFGYADGSVRLVHVTTGNVVATASTRVSTPIRALVIPPKEDGLAAFTDDGIWTWDLDADHPDVTIGSLFQKVWYEGYPEPMHQWQSTGGTDDNEPKLGLAPLVFGTVKATIYSMLFGLPLALLAAVFASEFLHPKVKSKIKPTIEVMASLPSVVLGFLAALVIAPVVADGLATVLTSFVTIPFTLLLGAHLWQLLQNETSIRLRRFRFPLMLVAVPLGILIADLLAPLVESSLFAGDMRQWLHGERGGGAGGWFFLLLPVSGLLVALLVSRVIGPAIRGLTAGLDRSSVALVDLAKFGASVVATLLVSFVLALVLDAVGLDPRGAVVGTYVQRNALIVGFVMGFAIIPIIFTIAEDALSAVPEHLRSASLGAGATPWQTATRIVIPTAMSGLFSAAMIGLGRAVGETMIVLMAAGNTPIMKWNPFSGFRTLSANLATELPEAVKDSTHYRVLFFAALLLFLMTFVLNTIAEAVRLRFRKRAYQL